MASSVELKVEEDSLESVLKDRNNRQKRCIEKLKAEEDIIERNVLKVGEKKRE